MAQVSEGIGLDKGFMKHSCIFWHLGGWGAVLWEDLRSTFMNGG